MPSEGTGTWEEALKEAWNDVDRAYERRREVLVAALNAGLTYRAIGEVVGMSSGAVHGVLKGKRGASRIDQSELLKAPAEFPDAN